MQLRLRDVRSVRPAHHLGASLTTFCLMFSYVAGNALAPFSTPGQTPKQRVVSDPAAFQDAVREGVKHIVIDSHLDMTDTERFDEMTSGDTATIALVRNNLGDHTRTIRGNCSSDPFSLSLTPPWKPGQCVIKIREDFLEIPENSSGCWISNLYLSMAGLEKGHATLIGVHGGEVYLTDIALVADGDTARAIDVSEGRRLYVERSHFSQFNKDMDAAIRLKAGSRATLNGVTFQNNTVASKNTVEVPAGPVMGMYAALGDNRKDGSDGSAAWFHDCTFENNTAAVPGEVAIESSICRVYTNTRRPTVRDRDLKREVNAWLLTDAVEPSGDVFVDVSNGSAARAFLRPSDDFFTTMVQEQSTETGLASFATPTLPDGAAFMAEDPYTNLRAGDDVDDDSHDDDGPNIGLIVGLSGAAAAACAIMAFLWFCCFRKSSRQREAIKSQRIIEEDDKNSKLYYQEQGSREDFAGIYAGPLRSRYPGSAASQSASQNPSAIAQSTMTATESSNHTGTSPSMYPSVMGSHGSSFVNPFALVMTRDDSLNQTAGNTVKRPEPLAADASTNDRMEYVQYQLDTLVGKEVLDGLVLEAGSSNRMSGGQAIIQFAKDRRSGLMYALKFFISKTAFADEAALYTNDGNPLGHFLPQLRNIVGGSDPYSGIIDGNGQSLPPCIVMEKGESLDVWMQRNRGGVDMVTGLQVIQHVAERLSDLHGAGFTHRDLKQSNVMWLPRENRWTLIDFGCAARIGEEAPLSYSLTYAPPEIIRAVQSGQSKVVAATSMDAWALGVVAVELFSRSSALNVFEGRELVMKRILGEQPLPWEEGAVGSTKLLQKLGRFQRAILGLLERDPAMRLTIPDFISRCRRVLEETRAA